MTPVCFWLPADRPFAVDFCAAAGMSPGELEIHRFPDGEARVRLGQDCAGRQVILVGGGRDPDRSALLLHFAAHAARSQSAISVGLVAPYLPYMRQDTQFRPGEAVSAHAYARFLSTSFDWLATVDPHLHRIRSLDEIFSIPALCASSTPAIAQWIAANIQNPIIVGPDSESRQWVEAVGQALQAPWTVLAKDRTGDRQVSVTLPDAELFGGRRPVIVDDIAASGGTLAEVTRVVRQASGQGVTAVVVHALLTAEALNTLRGAGLDRLVSTNTIAHPTNAIDVAPLLAARVRTFLDEPRPGR